jgi:predicted metal-binding protein
LKAKAKELGAIETKLIKASTIKTAAWVRMKCQYGCSGYGSNLCCPPHTPTPQQTQQVIDCYATALLIHCGSGVSPTDIVVSLERQAFLAGYYKAWGLGAGPCFSCKTCNLKKCIKQEKTRPSMESCGIDVYQTARANGFPIEVVKSDKSRQNY